MNDFEIFKNNFIEWSLNVAEKIQENGIPLCPYAKSARVTGNIKFFDGRHDLKKCLVEYTGEEDMGVIWLGDNSDKSAIESILDNQRKLFPNIIYFQSTPDTGHIGPSFTDTIIMHRMSDYLIKQRKNWEKGYYNQFPDYFKNKIDNIYTKLYPVKKQKNQVIGTEKQYSVFDYYVETPGSVLDIGGNAGNLLFYDNQKIIKYSCVDVSKDAIELGKKMFPESNFYYYNRLNEYYNPNGNKNEEFPKIESHDYVFINSVFTSSSFDDMIYIIEQSLKIAKKKIIFSVFDYKNEDLKNKFKIDSLIKESDISYTAKKIKFHNIELLKKCLEEKFNIKVEVINPCKIDNNFVVFYIENGI